MANDKKDINELHHGLADEVSPVVAAWRIFRKNSLALWGMVIFFIFFVTAVTGFIVTAGDDPVFDPAKVRLSEKMLKPFTPVNKEMIGPGDRPPFNMYVLGTDDLGRDVFSRMLQGAWVSLTVGFVAVGISVFIGIVLGGIAGYYGALKLNFMHILFLIAFFSSIVLLVSGQKDYALPSFMIAGLFFLFALGYYYLSVRDMTGSGIFRILFFDTISLDSLIMRLVDIMLCFPSFFLILTVIAILPASIYNIMIVIGLTSWMGTTRFVRAEFLTLREQDFVSAANAMGIRDVSIIFRHMMPNAIAPVIVSTILGIAGAIHVEAALSFLGFGVPPPHATWGNIFSVGKNYIFDAPWLTYVPGLAIFVVVLAFYLFGEGVRDAMNPKLRKR